MRPQRVLRDLMSSSIKVVWMVFWRLGGDLGGDISKKGCAILLLNSGTERRRSPTRSRSVFSFSFARLTCCVYLTRCMLNSLTRRSRRGLERVIHPFHGTLTTLISMVQPMQPCNKMLQWC